VKTRMLRSSSRISLGSLVCLALLASFSTSGAQTPDGPVPPQDGVKAPVPQLAPLRPGASGQPPHGTGFVPPPLDLSHLTGQRPPSAGVGIQSLPSSFDWRNKDGHNYVTTAKDQGACGACYAFASLGNIESRLLIDGAGTFDFSENNVKECNWYGTSCGGGNYSQVANLLSKKGTVLEPCDPFVAGPDSCKSTCPYQKTLLGWSRISGDNVPSTSVLKQYIYDHGPVYTSMYAGTCDPSCDAWGQELNNYDGSYTLYYTESVTPNHAVLIVGWDDTLSHAGGSGGWIVKNSWGTSWGDNGYFTIAYGSANIGMYSSFIYRWQDYDSDGDIMYYDEGGLSGYTGYASTTGWGMAVFTPTVDTNVTRVEFWTTDATNDVDVYIYDSFNGTTLSDKLAEVLDTSFNEAGYHSVALDSTLPVTAGNDVVAVVQFTNDSTNLPIPIDMAGPLAGSTYHSPDGSAWSASSYDVAIRLRTSSAPAPNVGITKQVVGSDFAPGDPITFTLTVANSGSDVAAHVVVTDDVPSQVLTPTCASTLALTQTGIFSYVWNVEPLGIGTSGVLTIYGWIDPSLDSVSAFTNTATISDPEDGTSGNNTSSVIVGGRDLKVYLPLVLENYPPGPTPGFWRSTTGGAVELYVTTDGAYVDDFAIYVNVPSCDLYDYKITHTLPEPIFNYQFSFSGSFYASGTFSSETTASGTTGLDHYFIEGCGYVSGDLGSWNASWQDDSQPAFLPAEIAGPETVKPVTTASRFRKVPSGNFDLSRLTGGSQMKASRHTFVLSFLRNSDVPVEESTGRES